MDTYQVVTGWLLDKIGWLANLMLLAGGIMVVSSRGSNVGIQLVLYGVVIGGIGALIGTGGIVDVDHDLHRRDRAGGGMRWVFVQPEILQTF